MAKRSEPRTPRRGVDTRYNVRAIERAIAVLNAFSFDEREMSLNRLTEKTELSKPTVFRILCTLESHGYVFLEPARGTYRLGSKFLELGGLVLSSLGLSRAARPNLDRLQAEIKVTVLFGTLVDDQLVYLDKRESQGPIRIVSDVGRRRKPNYGMLGMVLMAFVEKSEAERLLHRFPLEAYTRHSLTDLEAFRHRLEVVRREGYVVEANEAIEGVWGVAAPVWDARRKIAAAVGAASPLAEKSDARVAEVVDRVRACARDISEAMGYRPG